MHLEYPETVEVLGPEVKLVRENNLTALVPNNYSYGTVVVRLKPEE